MGEAGPPRQQTCEEATENTLGSFSSTEEVEQLGKDRMAVELKVSSLMEQEIRVKIIEERKKRDKWVQCCWQHLSPELARLIEEFAVEVSDDQVLAFLGQSRKLLPENIHNDTAAENLGLLTILAANCMLNGEYNKAVYIMLLGALGNELAARGPKHLGIILEKNSTLEQVCAYCCLIDQTVQARSRSKFIKYLSMADEENNPFVNIMRALEEETIGQADVQIHSLMQSKSHSAKLSEIIVTYADDGSGYRSSHECYVYTDTTLGWCTNRHSNNASDSSEKPPKSKSAAKGNKKLKRAKQKRSKSAVVPVLNEEQLAKQHRREHSQAMNPVLEALEPILRKIRIGLNNLSMHKTAPKVKHYNLETNASPRLDSLVLLDGEYSSKPGKACKVAYPVLVGEVSNLYKTSKLSPRHLTRIDLHGFSAEKAIEKLDENLPVWVDSAMRGNAPWVVGVDILCGGGSQIVSEAVCRWIRVNEQVANRPKGLV